MPLNLAALSLLLSISLVSFITIVNGEDPYRFFTWNITYGDIYPLGVRQQVKEKKRKISFSSLMLILIGFGEKIHKSLDLGFPSGHTSIDANPLKKKKASLK